MPGRLTSLQPYGWPLTCSSSYNILCSTKTIPRALGGMCWFFKARCGFDEHGTLQKIWQPRPLRARICAPHNLPLLNGSSYGKCFG
jgi:hypothetical protein